LYPQQAAKTANLQRNTKALFSANHYRCQYSKAFWPVSAYIGGHSPAYEKVMTETRETQERTTQPEAKAIIGIKVDYTPRRRQQSDDGRIVGQAVVI
jgi:uncharacterized protein YbjQ (UPF0145 family)